MLHILKVEYKVVELLIEFIEETSRLIETILANQLEVLLLLL